MRAYSIDLRQRILTDCDRGLSTRAVATKYSVSESWVRRLKQRRRQTGAVAARTATPGPKPSWDAYADRLREAIRQTFRRANTLYFYNVLYEGGVCDRNSVCTGTTRSSRSFAWSGRSMINRW